MRSTPLAACAAALAIIAAGCAGARAGGPGAADGAPQLVPADAVAFVAANTDLSAAAWHGLGAALTKQLQGWGAGLRAAAGDEIDVATLRNGKTVAFVRPSDGAKFAALVAERKGKLRKIGEWTAVARDEATLDAVAGAKSHLADNTLFLEAMARLPRDALVRAYANGEAAGAFLESIPGQLESRFIPPGARFRLKHASGGRRSAFGVGTQALRFIAADLTSTAAGLKLEAFAPEGDLTASQQPRLAVQPITPYTSALVDEIPAGALAVVDFQVPQGAFELLPQPPAALRTALGPDAVALPGQLDALLGGETALYVRAGFPLPEITLVTQPDDTAAASRTLDDLLRSRPQGSPFARLELHRAVIGGQFVVSTTQKGIDDLRSGGPKLSADPSFLEAKKQSGMPGQITGFAYVNGRDALPLLALAGVELPAGIPGLRTLAAFGGRSEREVTFSAFVGVSSS